MEKFSNLYKSLTHKKMKKLNSKSKKLLTTALFLTSGLTILSHSNPVNAEACPTASTITSPNDFGDATSFIATTGGSCYGTPEEYASERSTSSSAANDAASPTPSSFSKLNEQEEVSGALPADEGAGLLVQSPIL